MTDAIHLVDEDGALVVAKARVNHHGWVEVHNSDGGIEGLIPPQQVEEVTINVSIEEDDG